MKPRRLIPLDDDGSLSLFHPAGCWSAVRCAGPYALGKTVVACSTTLYEVRLTERRDGEDLKRCPDCKSWNVVRWQGLMTKTKAFPERPY